MNVGYLLGIDLDLPIWLILLIINTVLYVTYMTWNNGIFRKMGIPGPRPLPILGNLLPMFSGGVVGHDNVFLEKYGDIVGVFQGRSPIMLIRDPEIVKDVLVKQFNSFVNTNIMPFDDELLVGMLSESRDDTWRRLRLTMSPTFSGGKLKRMIYHINMTADRMITNLEEEVAQGNAINIESYCGCFTMDTTAAVAFGLQLDSKKDKENQFVKMAHKGMEYSLNSPIMIIFFFCPFLLPYLSKFGMSILPKDTASFFTKVTEQVIEEREKNPQKEPDFIQLMMNAHQEEDSEAQSELNVPSGKLKALTKQELVSNSVMFFLAGYDTTANTLAMVIYALTLHPECQEKLFLQIDEVIQGEELTYENINQMTYLDQVIDETLRLYPQGPRIERVANQDVTIKGVHIPKDMTVGIPIYNLHHDPKYWPDPEKFDPERFTPENKATHHPYTYLPFGLGPRQCIGLRLSKLQMKVALIKLQQKYKFVPAPETQIPIKLQKMKVAAENGVHIKLQPRSPTEE